jgi:hypothetical protein
VADGVTLSLVLCEKQAFGGKRISLFKTVVWPSIPPEGTAIGFGVDDEGERCGHTAIVRQVFFDADGSVEVDTERENLGDEYDSTVEEAKRDGFQEYADWKDSLIRSLHV